MVSSCSVQTSSVDLQAKIVIVDKLFCDHNKGVEGGCIRVQLFQSLSMRRSVFKGNKATERGGALSLMGYTYGKTYEVKFEIKNCSFIANQAREGGAMTILISKFTKTAVEGTVINSEFSANSAYNKGGAFSIDGNTPTLDTLRFINCIFSNNSAYIFGGVMTLSEISLLVISATIENIRLSK